MEVVSNNFMPGDPRLIDHIVYELKAQGIFDNFRKECIADVDTKPAYQNLRQRVEGSVTGFLKTQRWRPDMNKNHVREMLRKNISESGFLETGVERIVDQVVNPKINSIFLPQVENVVYKFLGIQKPSAFDDLKNQVDFKPLHNSERLDMSNNLLPSDLETVSPESEPHDKKLDISNESQKLEDRMDEDESPPFEPLEESTSFMVQEENSVDSHLSGFSGLASHDSNHSLDIMNKITPMEISNQDSQFSKQSSDDHLSIVMSDETETKMEINEDSTHSKTSNSKVTDSNSKSFDFMQDTQSSSDKSLQLTVKQDKIEDSKKTEDKPKSDEKKSDKHRSSGSYKHKSRHDSKSESKSHKDEKDKKSDKDKKEHREKSGHSSRDRKDRDKEKRDSKDKGKDEKDGESKSGKDYKNEKDRDRSKSSSSKHSSSKDRSSSKKESSESKTKDSSEVRDSKPKESSEHKELKSRESSENKDSKLKASKEKGESSKSRDDSRSKSETKSHNSSKSKGDTKSYSKHNGKTKPESSDSSKNSSKSSKKDDKSYRKEDKYQSRSDKHSSSSRKDEKYDKDKKDAKKDVKKETKDDHYSLKGKKTNRRSTDRDSSDGHSGTHSSSSSFADLSLSSQLQKTNQDSSVANSGSSSGDSGNSDQVDGDATSAQLTLAASETEKVASENMEENSTHISAIHQLPQVKLIKPKFASNIFEARRLMKIRKKLGKLEKQSQMELLSSSVALNNSPVRMEDDSSNHVLAYEIVPVPEEPENNENSKRRPNILKKQSNSLKPTVKSNATKLNSLSPKLELNITTTQFYKDRAKPDHAKRAHEHKKDAEKLRHHMEKHLESEEEDVAEVVEISDDSNSAPMVNSVISKESWDAVEAKLNLENILKVDYNSYTDSSEDVKTLEEKEISCVQLEDGNNESKEQNCIGVANELFLEAQRCVDTMYILVSHLEDDLAKRSRRELLRMAHHKKQINEHNAESEKEVDGLSRRLPKVAIVDVTSDNEIIISPSRGIKRHADNHPDVHNNNKTSSDLEMDLLDERLNHIGDKINHPMKTAASKVKKAKIIDSSVNHLDSFNLPLSPAESDKSFTTAGDKKSEKAEVKNKRNSTNRALNNSRNQRYSSDDLYKPRLQFSSTRRRAAKNLDIN